jgi:hypothetical protein
MLRRLALLPFVLMAVLVLGAAGAVVFVARSPLDERRDAVDARWIPLRAPLATRYEGLEGLAAALSDTGGAARTYTIELTNEINTWKRLVGRTDADPGAEAKSANHLEGLAQRIRANIAGSARLARSTSVTEALAAFDTALVPPEDVSAYNRAVRRYQSTRTALLRRLPAQLLGYGARPVLVLENPARL